MKIVHEDQDTVRVQLGEDGMFDVVDTLAPSDENLVAIFFSVYDNASNYAEGYHIGQNIAIEMENSLSDLSEYELLYRIHHFVKGFIYGMIYEPDIGSKVLERIMEELSRTELSRTDRK